MSKYRMKHIINDHFIKNRDMNQVNGINFQRIQRAHEIDFAALGQQFGLPCIRAW